MMFSSHLKTCLLALLGLFTLHLGHAQFGPGGVGDNDEVVLWLHNSGVANVSFSNPVWADISGYDNHASTTPPFTPGVRSNRFGNLNGLEFNGTNFLTVSNAPELEFNDRFSFAAVFGRQGDDGPRRYLFAKGNESTNSDGFSMSTSGAYVKARIGDGSGEHFDSVTYIGSNSAEFALVNHDDDEVAIYTSANPSGAFIHANSLGMVGTSDNLEIGSIPFGNVANNWTGFLGEVIIFDRELNAAEEEILQNYLGVTFAISFGPRLYVHGTNYKYDLAGIGRVSGVETQNDAKGLGIIRIDQPTDLDDGEFLLWAHDNDKIISGGTNENIWQVDHTGDVGSVRVRVYVAGYNIMNENDLSFFVSNNPNFNSPTEYQATGWDSVNEILTFENVDFGNNDHFTFSSNIVATGPPVIDECPLNISRGNDPGSCGSIVGWVPPISDGTMTSTHDPGDFFPVGTTTVTYTSINVEGGTTCSFTITVDDIELPVIQNCPKDITVSLDASCDQTVAWTPPTASDNCSVTFSATSTPGDFFPLGTTTVTYLATDPTGNTTTCSFDIIVVDNEPPVLTNCPIDIEVTDISGCEKQVDWVPPIATDNCNVTLTSTHNPNDVFPLGTTKVTYTAVDDAGNSVICSFGISVIDNINPIIANCDPTITISDFQPRTQDAAVSWVVPIPSDNCSVSQFIPSHNPGDRFPIGTTTVTYKADDPTGNTAFCSFDVVVTAVNTAPVVEPLAVSVSSGETVTVCLQAIDQEGDGVQLTQVSSDGILGTISTMDNNNLCFDYTAPEEFEGTESISVTICDDATPSVCTTATVEVTIDIIWELNISQLVTPNSDRVNDTWFIGNIDKYPANQVSVFDRWGSTIYQTESYDNISICWTGTKDGDPTKPGGLPSGTYFYQIQLEDGRSFKGFIELVAK